MKGVLERQALTCGTQNNVLTNPEVEARILKHQDAKNPCKISLEISRKL